MKKVYNTHATQSSPGTWRRIGRLCGFVVFAIVFLLANVSGWAHVPVNQQEPVYTTAAAPQEGLTFSKQHADPHPFNAGLVFVETEVASSSESGSEYQGDLDHAGISIPVLTLHSGKSLFLQLQLACESREKISLFVLHHAWKSFLS